MKERNSDEYERERRRRNSDRENNKLEDKT